MPRFLSTLLVVALLGGTAAAFAVTQGLKTRPSPITAPRVQKVFSPQCDCATRVAVIRFRLRKPDRVRLDIVDGSGTVVRTLVPGRRLRRGTVTYTWNGRDDQGRFVAQGVYKPRVHLADQHRTIDLPNEMQVDTTAPRISIVSLAPRTISPNGDGRNDLIRIAYRLSEPAHAILFVDGQRVIFTRRQLERSSLDWNGKVDGLAIRPGDHRVWLAAEDRAGNMAATQGRAGRRPVRRARPSLDPRQGRHPFRRACLRRQTRALEAGRPERDCGARVARPPCARRSPDATRLR